MSGHRATPCTLLVLALLVPRLAAHGYGTRPPWVSAGVVRVLAPADDAYLEVRVQHSGHLGARGALSAPDVFRIVQLAEPGSARTTPRWERELQRRALAPGDTLTGSGVLARAPLALALFPGGAALASADRHGVTVQERDGTVRFHAPLEALFAERELEEATEEHGPNSVWPFGWLEAPPRTVALWCEDAALVVALRMRTGEWLVRCIDATTGAAQRERRGDTALAAALAAAAAPEASIALELLALGAPNSTPTIATSSVTTPPDVALDAARRILANERATVEAQLVAVQLLARSVLASAPQSGAPNAGAPNAGAPTAGAPTAGAPPVFAPGEHEPTPPPPTRASDLELATASALRVLQRGDGHPSMDDLLAAQVLVGLAPALAPERWAAPLAELALARGVPELFPALTALGGAGVTALADAWLAVEAGRLSPYADPRKTSLDLVHHLARALRTQRPAPAPSGTSAVAAATAPSGALPEDQGATPATGAEQPLAAFARWLTAPGASGNPNAPSEAGPGPRGALLAALLAVEPTLDAGGDAQPDVRALLVRTLGAQQPAALDVAGPATRSLIGALIDALEAAAVLERIAPPGSPPEPDAARRARATDRAARAVASLQRIVDVPPPPFEPALRGATVPLAIAEARRWSRWWRTAAGRQQAAELAALVARGSGPDPRWSRSGTRFSTPRGNWPGASFDWPGMPLHNALEELFAEPRPEAWRVLERGLGAALERVDEFGLRGTLRKALAATAAAVVLEPEEGAARERVQRALGRQVGRH